MIWIWQNIELCWLGRWTLKNELVATFLEWWFIHVRSYATSTIIFVSCILLYMTLKVYFNRVSLGNQARPNFWWGQMLEERHIHRCSWTSVSSPKLSGWPRSSRFWILQTGFSCKTRMTTFYKPEITFCVLSQSTYFRGKSWLCTKLYLAEHLFWPPHSPKWHLMVH